MKTDNQVLTINIRAVLKKIMKDEIDRIPELLEELEPRDRLNLICKLMPFVFPKVQNVRHNNGEPFSFDL